MPIVDDGDHVQSQDRTQFTFPQGFSSQVGVVRKVNHHHAVLKFIKFFIIRLRISCSLTADISIGQQAAAEQDDESNPSHQDEYANWGVVEHAKGLQVGSPQRFADQDISRCTDQCDQTSHQSGKSQRH